MSLDNTAVRSISSANGVTVLFAIPQDIIDSDSNEVEVYLVEETTDAITGEVTAVETLQVEGALQDYTLVGASPPTTPFDTHVQFNTAPSNNAPAVTKVVVQRKIALKQPAEPTATTNYNSAMHELALDRIVAEVQQINLKIQRALKTRISIPDAQLDLSVPDPNAGHVLIWKDDETGLENIDPADLFANAGGSIGTLGLPTDGAYGATGGVSGVTSGITVEDGFDYVENVLEKLVPAKPQNCSAITLQITGSYSAYDSNGGVPVLHATVTDDTTPVVHHGAVLATDGFWDGDLGQLTARMDGANIGTRTLTTADDTGVYTQLEIVDDYDPYAGTFGQQNFWKALLAQINSAALTVASHVAEMIHSLTGTATLTFYVDDPGVHSISGETATGSGTGRYVSGIPCLTTGDTITAAFSVDDAVETHYNSTRIAAATSSVTNTVNQALPGTAPSPGDPVAASIALTVQAGQFSANASVTCRGYNSKGDLVSQAVTNNIRVDSISVETTRKKSGAGQYPAIGSGATQFGDAFDSTALLTAANNEELQLENATYKYPSATNYTTNTPTAGPDYTGVAAGSYANMRWATFNLGAVSAVTSHTFTINGSSGFGATALVSGIALYVKVDGAIPTTGWIDANAAYPGVGNPTNNGDAALVVGSSTATSKRVSFGASVKTGNLWVRIGIPSGSAKTFTGIT